MLRTGCKKPYRSFPSATTFASLIPSLISGNIDWTYLRVVSLLLLIHIFFLLLFTSFFLLSYFLSFFLSFLLSFFPYLFTFNLQSISNLQNLIHYLILHFLLFSLSISPLFSAFNLFLALSITLSDQCVYLSLSLSLSLSHSLSLLFRAPSNLAPPWFLFFLFFWFFLLSFGSCTLQIFNKMA